MIRLGIMGMGFMGQQHFTIHQQLENVKVVAVADKVAERVAEQAASVGGNIGEAQELDLSALGRYQGLNELLAYDGLDCVDICTPTFLHAEMTVQALEAGKHVICEKPMALTVEDCQRMIDAARANGRLLFVAQCIRFWPAYELLAQMIEDGELGRVVLAKFVRVSPAPGSSLASWFLDTSRSGGALLDLHIHDVDFIICTFGLPQAVWARAENLFSQGEKVDHVLTHYSYDDFLCSAEGGWAMPPAYPFEMGYQVLGEKGLLEFSMNKDPAVVFYPAEGEVQVPEVSPETGYERELWYFAQCMENNQPPERVTPESARESVRVVLAERESIRSGEQVALS